MLYFCDAALHTSNCNIPKRANNTENKYDEKFIITQAAVEDYKQESDEKMTKSSKEFKTIFVLLSNQINTMSSSPTRKDKSIPPDPTTVVQFNRRAPPLEEGNSTKIGGMWTLKHEVRSSKLYEILIKTEQKGDTDLYLKNFYNHINMCLNAVTRLR